MPDLPDCKVMVFFLLKGREKYLGFEEKWAGVSERNH